MAFCKNCGSELIANAKFCQKCGYPTDGKNTAERNQEFAGNIYKCPNCGEILQSFARNCPACGYELRGAKVTSAVKEFALKLERIEARREYEPIPKGFFGSANARDHISKTDEQKISLIQSFSVPNTTEDMLEFMILATSNVNMDAFDSYQQVSKSEKALSAAWASKINQVYEKARHSSGNKELFNQIETLYENFEKKSQGTKKKALKKTILTYALSIGWIPALLIVIFLLGPGAAKKEVARLEGIEQVAIQALNDGEYKKALLNAEALEYSPSIRNGDADDIERQWDIKRELLIDEILEKAADNGITLERSVDNEESENTTDESADGFVEGFKKGLQPGLDSAKENINKFNEIVNGTMQQSPKSVSSEASKAIEPESSNNTSDAVDFSANVIEKGAAYSFGHDEFNLYFATAISDKLIKIEKWGKHLATDKSFSLEYEVGAYKITDPANGFTWLDDLHTAFRFILQDEKNGDYKKSQKVIFTVSGSNGDTNKGTNYSEDAACFSYANDDWHIYKAIPLTDAIIKVECWYRPLAFGNFSYGYDICITGAGSDETDFEWTDDEHTSFTITLKDENNSDLKQGTFVAFTLE